MRLAVLSDIHGNLDALEAVLADLEAHGGADKIWVLGDLAAFGPHPSECVARLRALPEVGVIYGNTDRYLTTGQRPEIPVPDEAAWARMQTALQTRDGAFAWTVGQLSYGDYEYLSKLPAEQSLQVEGFGWVVGFHAIPGDDEPMRWPDTPDDVLLDDLLDREGRLALCGHTHLPMDRQLDGWRWVNVGSVGLPMDGDPRACYAMLDFDGAAVNVAHRRVAYDVPSVVAKLVAPNRERIAHILRTATPPA